MDTNAELPPDLIPAKDGAKLAKMGLQSFYRHMFHGKIPAYRRGRRWFVSEAVIRDMFKPWKAPPVFSFTMTPEARRAAAWAMKHL